MVTTLIEWSKQRGIYTTVVAAVSDNLNSPEIVVGGIVWRFRTPCVLGKGTLDDVDTHTTEVERGISPTCVSRSTTTRNFTASATTNYELLIELIEQRVCCPIAVERIVKSC